MATKYTFPHWETVVIDHSVYIPLVREILPLLRCIFFSRTQQGPVGVPVWVDSYDKAVSIFGKGTFDEKNAKFFSREALYMTKLFPYCGCFITRMIGGDAKPATVVLTLEVQRTDVIQYRRDDYGQFIIDPDTQERIPVTNDDGTVRKEPGVVLKWGQRPLMKGESIKNLKPTTFGNGSTQYTVFPILAATASDVGSYANDLGFKLFVDYDNMDTFLAEQVQSLPITFGAIKKTYGQDTVSPIHSTFQNITEYFVAKEKQVDRRVDRNVSFEDILGDYYPDLPIDFHLYSDYIAEVGTICKDVEQNDDSVSDPYLVNIITAENIEKVPYHHIVLSDAEDAIFLDESRLIYLQNGEDGDISDEAIEALTRQYLLDGIYPELLDQARYPFTHIIDTGVSIDTKKAFTQFQGKHDAHKLILATQDANMGRFNTKAEDLSMGASLFAAAILQPESQIKGTPCCRVEIYQQAGYLADSSYTGIVPSTIDIMMKKAQFQGSTELRGTAAGLPLGQVTIFKKWNWTPCDPDHKQRSWDSGLNYFQYYDMTGIFWPATRTVYVYETSVLTSTFFTDALIYCKHIARYIWARFAGVSGEYSALANRMQKALDNELASMINGHFNFSSSFYQTEEQQKIGFESTAEINLTYGPDNRVMKFVFNCYRTGYKAGEDN